MPKKNAMTWIWMQNGRLIKAVLNQITGTLTIYDEYDNILLRRIGLTVYYHTRHIWLILFFLTVYYHTRHIWLRRIGLTKKQIKNIEIIFTNHCVKRLGDHREPFTYL